MNNKGRGELKNNYQHQISLSQRNTLPGSSWHVLECSFDLQIILIYTTHDFDKYLVVALLRPQGSRRVILANLVETKSYIY